VTLVGKQHGGDAAGDAGARNRDLHAWSAPADSTCAPRYAASRRDARHERERNYRRCGCSSPDGRHNSGGETKNTEEVSDA
jgi:hypothetical protein